jgi:hypothetical protein
VGVEVSMSIGMMIDEAVGDLCECDEKKVLMLT